MTLSDFADRRIAISRERCDRAGSYSAAKMLSLRGDVRLTDLLVEITADCPRRKTWGLLDQCAARYLF